LLLPKVEIFKIGYVPKGREIVVDTAIREVQNSDCLKALDGRCAE
jgi:hypothetical protein